MSKKNEVRLHNHLAEARYKFNPAEQKVFIYAISMIDHNSPNFNEVEFKIDDLAKATNMSYDRLSRDLKSIARNIIETSIESKDPDNPEDWVLYSLATKCKHVKKTGIVQFKFNEDMKPLLLDLQKHYFVQHPTVIKFKSFHSIRLYDFFRAKVYDTNALETTIEQIKDVLELNGKYKVWKDFKNRVLDPAMEEINTSDLKVTYEMKKRGRSAFYLDFTFELEKQHTSQAFKLGATKFKPVVDDLREQLNDKIEEFSDGEVYEFYCLAEIHEPNFEDTCNYISRSIDYMNRPMKTPIKNRYSYLKKSIDEGYVYGQMTMF